VAFIWESRFCTPVPTLVPVVAAVAAVVLAAVVAAAGVLAAVLVAVLAAVLAAVLVAWLAAAPVAELVKAVQELPTEGAARFMKSEKARACDETSTTALVRSWSKLVVVLVAVEVTSCMGCSFGRLHFKSRSKVAAQEFQLVTIFQDGKSCRRGFRRGKKVRGRS
jgi:mannitol-specific phosphotransferase system IIBC component